MVTKLGWAVVPVVALCAAATTAKADVIYTYTGTVFTNFPGLVSSPTYSAADKLTGMITLSAAIGDSQTNLDVDTSVVSFSFSDGNFTLSSASCCAVNTASDPSEPTLFEFTTNSSGTIIGWNITIENAGDANRFESISADHDETLVSGVNGASNSGDSGTWSVQSETAVPEPGSLTIFGAGLAMLGVMRRKRKAS